MNHEEIYESVRLSLGSEFTDLKMAIAMEELERYRKAVMTEILSVDDLIKQVCIRMDVKKESLFGKTRKRNIVEARMVVWYLLSNRIVGKKLGLVQLGMLFDKDHATALHGIKKISAVIEYDQRMREDVMQIANVLGYTTEWDPSENKLIFAKNNPVEKVLEAA